MASKVTTQTQLIQAATSKLREVLADVQKLHKGRKPSIPTCRAASWGSMCWKVTQVKSTGTVELTLKVPIGLAAPIRNERAMMHLQVVSSPWEGKWYTYVSAESSGSRGNMLLFSVKPTGEYVRSDDFERLPWMLKQVASGAISTRKRRTSTTKTTKTTTRTTKPRVAGTVTRRLDSTLMRQRKRTTTPRR